MHHSLHLKMAFKKPVWIGKQTRQERRAGEGAGAGAGKGTGESGFALSRDQVILQGAFAE